MIHSLMGDPIIISLRALRKDVFIDFDFEDIE